MIPLFKVFVSDGAKTGVSEVLSSGYIGQGPKVDQFERKLSEFLGQEHLLTLNSGTSALHLALHLLKTEFPDKTEVLTIPLTCTATNFPIRANGLDIRWVDTDPTTCNIDYDDLESKLSEKTLAIMVVHWGGYPCDLDKLRAAQDKCATEYHFCPRIIEDCAHAIGAKFRGKTLGSHGNYCCFSFQAIKHLTCGDGGLLSCPTPRIYERAKLLRWYGLDRTSSQDMRCVQNVGDWGFKFHMNDINASIGIANLDYLPGILQRHRSNAAYYDKVLAGVDGVRLLDYTDSRMEGSFWVYTIRVEHRDDFARCMADRGVGVSRVHDRNDKHACLAAYREELPGTDEICADMICIPCGWWVSDEDREYITAAIREGW